MKPFCKPCGLRSPRKYPKLLPHLFLSIPGLCGMGHHGVPAHPGDVLSALRGGLVTLSPLHPLSSSLQ